MEQTTVIIEGAIQSSLKIIEQEREKKIISRRFGLDSGRKETLEQIGTSLSITRERVRQLEKAILVRLHINAEDGEISELATAEKFLIRHLSEMGRIATIESLGQKIYGRKPKADEQAKLAFLAEISASLTLIPESDLYHAAIGIADYGDEKTFCDRTAEIVTTVRKHKEPISLETLDAELSNYEHPDHISSAASISKLLACRNDYWGLTKWPSINPKNIRDKIYVILEEKGQPMHFSTIAEAIANSNFKRRDVTTQAIHNELIKDSRFVLIGRGIYALESWGYMKGTVAEIIITALKKYNRPMTREEIVKFVLRNRKVKETTVLLNLQNKKLFTKLEKNSYTLTPQ